MCLVCVGFVMFFLRKEECSSYLNSDHCNNCVVVKCMCVSLYLVVCYVRFRQSPGVYVMSVCVLN